MTEIEAIKVDTLTMGHPVVWPCPEVVTISDFYCILGKILLDHHQPLYRTRFMHSTTNCYLVSQSLKQLFASSNSSHEWVVQKTSS